MVAHGGTSVAGSFIQTLTTVGVATGWTECLPLVTRESGLVVEAMSRAQSLFLRLVVGTDLENDSAFMNDVVVPWWLSQKIEVTRSRAYKKNDQAFASTRPSFESSRMAFARTGARKSMPITLPLFLPAVSTAGPLAAIIRAATSLPLPDYGLARGEQLPCWGLNHRQVAHRSEGKFNHQ
jgi:hypothetical protein